MRQVQTQEDDVNKDRVTKFENALIELIDMHMNDGLTAQEVRAVLDARSTDDFDAGRESVDLTRVVGGPQTEAVKRFGKMGA